MRRHALIPLLSLMLLALASCRGLLTEAPAEREIFDVPFAELTPAQMRAHLAGDEAFGELFTPATGLGPVFNQTSCEGCHPGEGRGHPTTNLIRFGRAGDKGFDYMHEFGGPQLQDRAIPGYPAEKLPAGYTGFSERGGPIVAGLGLVEAISDEAILANEDPADTDGDGISGRANFVPAPAWLPLGAEKLVRDGKALGRFGRKATAITLLQQTAAAYHDDMGITSDFLPEDPFNPLVGGPGGDQVPDPEISRETLHNVVLYLQTLRPPQRRNAGTPAVLRGEAIFRGIGCDGCHIPELRTAESPIAALAFQRVPLYSDLLLHDLGPALADNFPEGGASGSEWRTTPLWGLGIVANLLGGTPFYLHDGRTSDLHEAIALHGGEAEAVTAAYLNLPEDERQALLSFLNSL